MPHGETDSRGAFHGWGAEAIATARLAWPLVMAQLATIAINATDVVMMGWLGADYLAAGTLASAMLHPLLMFGVGVTTASAPLIAQAIGARAYRSVRRSTRQGLWVGLALSAIMVIALTNSTPLFALFGQDPGLSRLAARYLDFAAWFFIPAFMAVALRGFVSAQGKTRVVLAISVIGIFVNALGNYALMFGNFGLPRLELRGAGISTTFVHLAMFLLLLGYIVTHRKYKRFAILVRFWKPDWPRFWRILRLGAPIGAAMASESALFAGAAALIGWLGAEALAAHAIASQLAAVAFMVPLGLSHATTIRVGLAHGRRDRAAAARAGWVSIAMATGAMCLTAMAFWLTPYPLIHMFLDPADPANAGAIALAASYLGIAALFQLVDGMQVAAAAALRGMNDTDAPMVIAVVGYWAVGLPVGYLLGFPGGLDGLGVWIGLATGLAFAALALTWRFARASVRAPPPG